jgi:hypothetical protein
MQNRGFFYRYSNVKKQKNNPLFRTGGLLNTKSIPMLSHGALKLLALEGEVGQASESETGRVRVILASPRCESGGSSIIVIPPKKKRKYYPLFRTGGLLIAFCIF